MECDEKGEQEAVDTRIVRLCLCEVSTKNATVPPDELQREKSHGR